MFVAKRRPADPSPSAFALCFRPLLSPSAFALCFRSLPLPSAFALCLCSLSLLSEQQVTYTKIVRMRNILPYLYKFLKLDRFYSK
jgi:hypothetical protein